MEVKDANNVRSVTGVSIEGSLEQEAAHAAVTATAPTAPRETVDSVTLHSSVRLASTARADVRVRANQAISAINLAVNATSEISRMADSIDGIVEQAAQENVQPQRRQILEKEANQLIAAIRDQASQQTDSGVKPLSGDPIRLEVERELGRTLEFILPDDAARAFDLGSIRFSPKEAIIQTQVSVKSARQSIEDLRSAVETVERHVRGAVDTLEVALQNSEAATASITDVDAALTLAGATGDKIGQAPDTAMHSIGTLDHESATLLK